MSGFVICIDNEDYPASLVLGKVYRLLPDPDADRLNLIRVQDEDRSEPGGYLYPSSMFVRIDVPEIAEQALLAEEERSRLELGPRGIVRRGCLRAGASHASPSARAFS